MEKSGCSNLLAISNINLHLSISMTPWPSWLRRKTVNLEIVSSILTGVALFFFARFQIRNSLIRNSSFFFFFLSLPCSFLNLK